jgi:hypothetical protein
MTRMVFYLLPNLVMLKFNSNIGRTIPIVWSCLIEILRPIPRQELGEHLLFYTYTLSTVLHNLILIYTQQLIQIKF